MPSGVTDGNEGFKIVSQEDGLVAIQINNNTNLNLYLCSGEKNQSYSDRAIVILPNQQWPQNGPVMWYGDLWIWCDQKRVFGYIKSLAISKRGGITH